MLPGKTYSPDAIVALLVRQRWLVVLPFLVTTFVAASVAWYLPSVYRSTAIVSIIPQQIPESYVRTTVTLGPQDRVEAIRRDVLSRPKLERIITEFGLYGGATRTAAMEDVVERMRSVDVKMVETKGNAFEVSFSAGDPALSQKVTERLADLFIQENIRQRTRLADGSSDFLKNQLAQAREQLVATEKRLETYRRAHSGELPDQVEGNLQAITNTHLQLQQLRESINRDRDRRLALDRQITDLEQPIVDAAAITTDRPGAIRPSQSAAEQLQQAVANLADMERRLTPEHPDVRRAKRIVAELQVAEQDEQAARDAGRTVVRSPGEELRRRRLRDLRAELTLIDGNVAVKTKDEERLQALAAGYQARVNAAPSRESELTSLLRDYDTVSQQYKTILTNSKSAEMAQELERRQGGEQFRLLEGASLPARPSSPKRPLILGGGAAFGLAFGLVVVGFMEFKDRSLRLKDDVTALLGLPVLAVVPTMSTPRDQSRQARLSLAMWAVAAVLSAGTAIATWGALHR
jgi:polysaccharide chain length determinant protein (PEP-CTERM system associated)